MSEDRQQRMRFQNQRELATWLCSAIMDAVIKDLEGTLNHGKIFLKPEYIRSAITRLKNIMSSDILAPGSILKWW